MKKICGSLREHAMKIINFKKKKNEGINKRAIGIIKKEKICYICQEKYENEYLRDKEYRKVRNHCHYAGDHGCCA